MAKARKSKPIPRRLLVQMVHDLSQRLQAQGKASEAIAVCVGSMVQQARGRASNADLVLAMAVEKHAESMRDLSDHGQTIAARSRGE